MLLKHTGGVSIEAVLVELLLMFKMESVNEKHFHQPNQAKTEADKVIEGMKKEQRKKLHLP